MVWEVSEGVWKEIVTGGIGQMPSFSKNTKVLIQLDSHPPGFKFLAIFHFKSYRISNPKEPDCDPDEDELIDDTRTLHSGPFELLIDREFKVKVWENAVKTMKIKEVARFGCEFKQVVDYCMVSKALRNISDRKKGVTVSHRSHQCGFSAMTEGTGYKDLDELIANRQPLLFEFELLYVISPDGYQQELWHMEPAEKLKRIPQLREEGNALYKSGKHIQASEKYEEALLCFEQLLIREQPNSVEWVNLQQKRVPLLLNHAQCMLLQEDYNCVIRNTTAALEQDCENVKAYFRRGKAHAAIWNVDEAKRDFAKVVELDSKQGTTVSKELLKLEQSLKHADAKELEQMRKAKCFQ